VTKRKRGHGRGATNQGMAANTFAPMDVFKPFRDRPVQTSKVDCPECESLIGSKCVSKNGKELNTAHRSRYRLALRSGL
jgi:hypothetical protein